ncbi:MAG: AmmeMemoRadiSam system protein B [Anaerolineae bacterium]
MAQAEASDIRPAQFADDQWYPSTASRLQETVKSLIDAAKDAAAGRPLGLVAPHAGLRFSGAIAAQAYRQAQGQAYDVVAVISPLHRLALGAFTVSRYRYYATPLGLIPVAEDLLAEVARTLPIARVGRDNEHSLEIQLPFLQYAIGDFALLPIMMGDQSLPACEALASALSGALAGRSALIVASSDLSHFHPYDTAVRLDRGVAEKIEAYDPGGLAEALELGTTEACGGGPIVTALLACRTLGATRAVVLAYANSGDVWVDRSSVVGYLAAAFYGGDIA